MNDNLKELEEFVNQNKEDGYFGLSSEMIQLIGNLILRNKEVEEIINNLEKECLSCKFKKLCNEHYDRYCFVKIIKYQLQELLKERR